MEPENHLKRKAITVYSLGQSESNQALVMPSPQRRRCYCGSDYEYLKSFPPGYKFCPTDADLVVHYLMRKVRNQQLPENNIRDANLYCHNPDKLTENYRKKGEKEWYFFTPRDRKYRNGSRPNRAAGNGYWKATGPDKNVIHNGKIVGLKKALVFHVGKAPKGNKTNWIMHEFVIKSDNQPPRVGRSKTDMRLDDWVLCRIYKKSSKGGGGNNKNDQQSNKEDSSAENYENTLPPVENNIVHSSNEQLLNTVVGYFHNNPHYNGVGVGVVPLPPQNGFGVPHIYDDPFLNFGKINNRGFSQNSIYGSAQPVSSIRTFPPMMENSNFMPQYGKQENATTGENGGADQGIFDLENYSCDFSDSTFDILDSVIEGMDKSNNDLQKNPEIGSPDDPSNLSDKPKADVPKDEPKKPDEKDLPDSPKQN